VIIRPAQPADTPTLMQLTAETGVFKPYEVEVLKDVLDTYHAGEAGPEHVAAVAEDEGRVVGYVYYAPDVMTDRTWYLYWIAVSKDQQGRGLGGKLLEFVERDIREQNGRLLLIETSSTPHYEPTRKFYLKYGYTLAANVPDFYAEGDGLCVFSKRLAPAPS
jgi:ribosomal protein S18 acetylase RimI-like enzyme